MEIGCNIQKPRVRVTKVPLGHNKGKKLFNVQSISGKLLESKTPKSQRAGRVHRHSQLVLPPKDFFYKFLQGMKPKI